MTGQQALDTSRPVLFEHSEPFLYYGAGSALLCAWEGVGYVVTARHIARQGPPNKVRIARDDHSLLFFRFERELTAQGDEEDWKDLAFYRVHRHHHPEEWIHLALPLAMEHFREVAGSYEPGMRVLVSGYPGTHRSIDYDAAHISTTRCIIPGVYEAADSSARGLHRLRIAAELETFDGLSGAPVFLECAPKELVFGGIVIQGTASSRLLHFIGVTALAAMFSQLHKAAA